MLKHLPLFAQQRVQHMLAVILVSAPQDMMVRARNHLDGIKLHKPKLFDQPQNIQRAGRCARQPMSGQPQRARCAIVDSELCQSALHPKWFSLRCWEPMPPSTKAKALAKFKRIRQRRCLRDPFTVLENNACVSINSVK